MLDYIQYITLLYCLNVCTFCIILLFGFKALLIWNPYKEARHEFAARDKRHEIRLENEKVTSEIFLIILNIPKPQKREVEEDF